MDISWVRWIFTCIPIPKGKKPNVSGHRRMAIVAGVGIVGIRMFSISGRGGLTIVVALITDIIRIGIVEVGSPLASTTLFAPL